MRTYVTIGYASVHNIYLRPEEARTYHRHRHTRMAPIMAPPLSGLWGGSETEGRDLYHICAFGDGLSCEACALRRELICRDLRGERRLFVLSQVPFFLLSFFGMGAVGVATGVWWPIFAYSAAGMAFLGPGEMALLCRHCPHYARVVPRLRCIGPNPFPKLFSPRPQPTAGLAKVPPLLFLPPPPPFPSLFWIHHSTSFASWAVPQ